MLNRRFAINRSCSSTISAIPAAEKLRCGLIFLSSISMITRSMMSPICSMLIVKLMMSVHRRLSSSPSASREMRVM
ncbi:hypothetical protein D3C72_1868890 [compost metagenome]